MGAAIILSSVYVNVKALLETGGVEEVWVATYRDKMK